MTVNKQLAPYVDDFDDSKNFYQILFNKNKRAVQVRELNQIQSLLQDQISKFGDHIFEEGSLVIPGESTFDLNYSYVKLTVTDYLTVKEQLKNQGVKATGNTSGSVADVVEFVEREGSDDETIYVKYTNNGLFQTSETVTFTNSENNTFATATVNETGVGSKFTVAKGIFYVKGYFVVVDTQSILLDKYSNTPSYSIGFDIVESVVTTQEDSSLFDNANGTPNFKAPGADRLKIELVLNKYAIGSTPDEFVELTRLENGELLRKARGPEYNILEDVLAKRTFDESGNYTVEDFGIELRDHLKVLPTGGNNFYENDGLYLPGEGGDDNLFAVGVEKGRAYVQGYEIENNTTQYINVDKARTENKLNNVSISATIGSYIEIEEPTKMFRVDQLETVYLYDSTPSLIGIAKARLLQNVGTNYRLYLVDIQDDNGNADSSYIPNVTTVSGFTSTSTANIYKPNVDYPVILHETRTDSAVYPLPQREVKTLLDGGISDTSFTGILTSSYAIDANDEVVVNAPSGKLFIAQDTQFAIANHRSTNTMIDISGRYTLEGSPTGSSIRYDFSGLGLGQTIVDISIIFTSNTASAKTKARWPSFVESTSINSKGNYPLSKADVVKIRSVIDNNGVDVTRAFKLFPNKTKTYYGLSYIRKINPNITVVDPITVDYSYFIHAGTGDFFSADSYSTTNYQDVPVETIDGVEYRATDLIDFRPILTSNTQTSVLPLSLIRCDVTHYLPRIDKVVVDAANEFSVIKGVPAIDPKEPKDPESGMVLYKLSVPAFTFEAKDIKAEKVSTRRYTMKDIGKLETRIANLEYYVVLNNLEKDTADLQIIDPDTGLNRFKNGFVVDRFIDHSVGDFEWEDYRVSVDRINEQLRPQFKLNGVDLEINAGSSTNYASNNGIVTLGFNEINFLEQNISTGTLNVNPYAVFRWSGSLTLNPSEDSWIDTVYQAPDVIFQSFNNGVLEQNWSSWQLNWSGVPNASTRTLTTTNTFGRVEETTTTTTSVIDDKVVDTTVIPYMRENEVTINGTGFMPNATLYPFFDNRNVDAYCKPSGGNFGDPITSDVNGDVTLTFKIPNTSSVRFRTGSKVFSLSDNASNQEENAITYGEATYTASGVQNKRQKTIVATRRTTRTRTRWKDPLAQSFLVETSGGIFVTSIELYFASKDASLPVTVDIREMENGTPTQRVVPGSEKTLNPSQVLTSTTGLTATKFTFNHPIYLQEDTEYCYVVTSNSNNYEVYVAEIGQKQIGSDKFVSKQPYVGVLFKSQNSSTWTADQNTDMKFKINRASFVTNTATNVVFNNKANPYRVIGDGALYVTNGSQTAQLRVNQHGLNVGNSFEFRNAVDDTGSTGFLASDINQTFVVTNVIDYNTLEFDIGKVATDNGYIGGGALEMSQNFIGNVVQPKVTELTLPNTNITYKLQGTTTNSFSGSETPYLTATEFAVTNLINNSLTEPLIACSSVDETDNLSGNKSVTFTATLTSDKENISPVIDLYSSNLVYIQNEIDAQSTDDTEGLNTWAKYRTNVISLANVSSSLKVYSDIYQPSGSTITLSYRVGNSEEEVLGAAWQDLPVVDADLNSLNTFAEYEYGVDDIADFTFYQVMIKMRSTSNVVVPSVRKFRALALGT